MESDESNTVQEYLQSGISLAEVGFLEGSTYKGRIGISITKAVLHPASCLVDTGTALTLINEDFLKSQRTCTIRRLKPAKLRNETKEATYNLGAVPLIVHVGDLQGCVWLGIVQNLTVRFLLRTFSIYECVQEEICRKHQILLEHSAPVAILGAGTGTRVT